MALPAIFVGRMRPYRHENKTIRRAHPGGSINPSSANVFHDVKPGLCAAHSSPVVAPRRPMLSLSTARTAAG